MALFDIFNSPSFFGGRVDPTQRFLAGLMERENKEQAKYAADMAAYNSGQTSGGYANPQSWMSGVAQWSDVINRVSREQGISANLIAAIMSVESGGNAKAKSYAGALGLMQVMPSWFEKTENPLDPYTNISRGASILKQNYQKFGDWNKAIAAYWQGAGAVAKSGVSAGGKSYADKVNSYLTKYGGMGGTPGYQTAQKAIDLAKTLVGYDRYVMGVTINPNDPRPKVTDCSSMVQWAYGKVGVKLPRTAQQQYDATQRIDKSQLQPGDLVFFTKTYNAGRPVTHVGIYIGNGMMINSTGSQGRGTVIQSIDTPYWRSHYYGAGRIAGVGGGGSGSGPAPTYKPPFFSPTALKF